METICACVFFGEGQTTNSKCKKNMGIHHKQKNLHTRKFGLYNQINDLWGSQIITTGTIVPGGNQHPDPRVNTLTLAPQQKLPNLKIKRGHLLVGKRNIGQYWGR